MAWEISKSTTLCVSLSARPSNIGTRFHNYLYRALELDYVYKAFAPANIEQAILGILGLGIRGAAISMPYKEAVIPLIDSLDKTAAIIESVNTIVNTDGELRGYNTDFAAVRNLLDQRLSSKNKSVLVIGSGGMAKAVVAAISDLGITNCKILARNETSAAALASKYGFTRISMQETADVIINATPIGMSGGADEDLAPVSDSVVENAELIFDVVAVPAITPLIAKANSYGKEVVIGTEVMTLQAVEQFVLYTGIRPSDELISQAAQYSRSE